MLLGHNTESDLCTTVHSLTADDFYNDTNVEILTSTDSSNAYSLSVHNI